MEDSGHHSSVSHSTLLCEENEACLNGTEEGERKELNDEHVTQLKLKSYVLLGSEDPHRIEVLLEREVQEQRENEASPCLVINGGGWIKCARRDAIQWILKTRAVFGFGYETAYLSITYFDRFLIKRAIDGEKMWAIRLLSVACLSLAAKMEECRVPQLSEFEVEYSFDSKVILRMELMVLSTLQWRMGSITPFPFIHYFITKFNIGVTPQSTNAIVPSTVEHIMAVIKERDSVDHRPSIIASASVLMAMELDLSDVVLKTSSISSSCQFLKTEDVVSCYNLMQDLDLRNPKRPRLAISPDLSPVNLRRMNVMDGFSVTSGVSVVKRRRLAFNDFDLNHGMPDEQ